MLSIRSSEQKGQAGFTLVELVIVATLMVMVLGAILGVLDNLTTSQHTTSARIDASLAARLTLAQLSRDLHGARILSGARNTELDVVLGDSFTPTYVQWVFAAGALTRYAGPAPPPSPVEATAALPNLVAGQFTFTGAPSVATPGDVSNCALTVMTVVSVRVSAHVAPQTQTVVDELPNQVRSAACG